MCIRDRNWARWSPGCARAEPPCLHDSPVLPPFSRSAPLAAAVAHLTSFCRLGHCRTPAFPSL
eukprot:8950988-Alexandrium_andersonii.AAC.1